MICLLKGMKKKRSYGKVNSIIHISKQSFPNTSESKLAIELNQPLHLLQWLCCCCLILFQLHFFVFFLFIFGSGDSYAYHHHHNYYYYHCFSCYYHDYYYICMCKNKLTLCDFTYRYDICVQCDIPRQYLCSGSSPKYMGKNEKQ